MRQLNWDRGDFETFLCSENAAKAYDEETQAAIDRKVFGVPTVFGMIKCGGE
jgi:2-hydroxychromene-2-carboxylate isomerase